MDFRSQQMQLCEIYLQPEAAYNAIEALGDMGNVEFIDMTPGTAASSRPFVNEIRRLSDMTHKLRYMKNEMVKNDVYIPPLEYIPRALQPNEIIEYEALLETNEQTLREIEANETELLTNYKELSELHYVNTTIGPILGNVELRKNAMFLKDSSTGDAPIMDRNILSAKTGVVDRAKCKAFEQMLWRISKGNIYFKTASHDRIFVDPVTDKEVRKVAFVAVCQPEELTSRVDKVCQGFHATLYPLGASRKQRHESVENLSTRLEDIETVLKKTKYHRCKVARTIGRHYNVWNIKIKKAIAIYNTLNLFNNDFTRKCLVGQCWVPKKDMADIQKTLSECSEKAGSNVKSFVIPIFTKSKPPTFLRNNKYTYGFHAIIAAYGDPHYKEVNPGYFAVSSFPFLFAVMFGDFGHAIFMTLFAMWMIGKEKKYMAQTSDNEIWKIFFTGRYVILLMGIQSMYTGFVYNDFFSKRVNLDVSYWISKYSEIDIKEHHMINFDPKFTFGSPYIYGVDPVWSLATNSILFENSLKMKLSIIIGVLHMIFGLCLSVFNHHYFHHHYALLTEFIPQLLFLCCLFLWLVFLIYYKWITYSAKATELYQQPGCAPLVLILFIDMMLLKTSESQDPNCKAYMFEEQHSIQKTLLAIALLSVPVLLFGTPIYLYFHYQDKIYYDDEEEEHTCAEIMIHQSIHTIEFVLSTISHTASYLRLWALSLAHSQLSDMLWNMVFLKLALVKLESAGAVWIFIIFSVWAAFSFSILILMESLSAFLHTLRLHWVEFMSKFFVGDGRLFLPFSFDSVVES